MSKIIETDLRTFIKFWLVPLGIALAIFLIFEARVGLIIIGISIFLALALRPLVRRVNHLFTKYFGADKKHQSLSVVMAYLIVVIVIGGIIAIVGPVVVDETVKFVQKFPETFESTLGGWEGINRLGQTIGIENLQNEIFNTVTNFSNNILGVLGTNIISSVSGVADFLMKLFLVLILTLLFLLEGPDMVKAFWNKIAAKNDKSNASSPAIRNMCTRMADVISTYVAKQVTIAALDGCASTVIVFVLTLIFQLSPSLALPMGMITMIFYLVPMFGQFIGGTLVTLLLLFSNPLAALIFAIVYIVYTQIENNIIAPKIQGDALNLRPVIILAAITVGVYTFGLLGAIIAIPIAGCVRVLIEEYPKLKGGENR